MHKTRQPNLSATAFPEPGGRSEAPPTPLTTPVKTGSAPRGLPGARGAVLVVWAVMFLGAVEFVARYSSSVPYGVDDWWFVPYLTGHARVLPFLWEQTAQNRYAVTRAVYLGLLKLGGGDYRAVLFFVVFGLGALSLAMIQAARKVRGYTSYTDIFFPLVLLSWGLAEMHLLWASGLHYLLPTFLAFSLLVMIVRRGVDLPLRTGLLAGVTLVLLALASGSGLLYTFALGPWLAWCGIRRYRSPGPAARRDGLVMLGLAAAALAVVPLYFINFQRSSYGTAKNPDYWVKFQVAVSFLSGGYGAAGLEDWKIQEWSVPAWLVLGWFVFGLLTIGGVVLATTLWARDKARASRALGLLFFMGGMGCVAGAIGWGRDEAGPGPTCYYGLALPFLIFVYFAGVASRWRAVGASIQLIVLASVVGLLYPNTMAGLQTGRDLRQQLGPVEDALREDRVPPYLLVARYHEAIWPENKGGPYGGHKDCVEWLRQKKLGLFARMQPDPPLQPVTVPPTPVQVEGLTWEGNRGEGTSADAYVVFALPRPMNVAYVRIRGELSSNELGETMRRSRVFWKTDADADFQEGNFNYLLWDRRGGAWEGTACIAATIDRIKVVPGAEQIQVTAGPSQAQEPITFRIDELTFLVPEDSGPARP